MEQELYLFTEAENALSYPMELARDEVFFESARDYVLPDYQPEIRKLFSISSEIFSSGKYENGGRAECGGSLSHTLLYSDGESAMQSLVLSSDYDYAYDGGDAAEGALLFGSERILSVACRLSGPRRLSIRVKMAARLHMIGERRIACVPVGAPASETAVLKKEVAVMHTERRESEVLLTESVSLPLGSPDVARLFLHESRVLFRDTRVREDGITVRGEVQLKMLLAEGDGIPFVETVKLPFDETLYATGLSDGCGVVAEGEIRKTEIQMEEATGGVAAHCEVSLLLLLTIRENRKCEVTSDLFFAKNDACLTYETLSLPCHMGSMNGRFSVGQDFPTGEGEASLAVGVIDTVGRAYLSTVESGEGYAVLTGECRVRFLLSGAPDEEGRPRLFSVEYSAPFRHEVPQYGAGSDCIYEATVDLESIGGRLDGNHLSFSADLGYTLCGIVQRAVTAVTAAEATTAIASDSDVGLTVLYPAPGESLWSLGKRCHTLPKAIAAENGLPESAVLSPDGADSLAGVVRVFLP